MKSDCPCHTELPFGNNIREAAQTIKNYVNQPHTNNTSIREEFEKETLKLVGAVEGAACMPTEEAVEAIMNAFDSALEALAESDGISIAAAEIIRSAKGK